MYLPQNYQDWFHCITVDCKIKLDTVFFDSRIKALQRLDDPETRKFIQLYGENYHQQVL